MDTRTTASSRRSVALPHAQSGRVSASPLLLRFVHAALDVRGRYVVHRNGAWASLRKKYD